MNQLARIALGGHVVVPAAGDVGLGVEAKNALADGIAMMMVVEQPAVMAGFAQRSLDCLQIHRCILSCSVGVARRICSECRMASRRFHFSERAHENIRYLANWTVGNRSVSTRAASAR